MWGVGISTNDDVVLERVESALQRLARPRAASATAGGSRTRGGTTATSRRATRTAAASRPRKGKYWSDPVGGRARTCSASVVWSDISNVRLLRRRHDRHGHRHPVEPKPWLGTSSRRSSTWPARTARARSSSATWSTRNGAPFLIEESPLSRSASTWATSPTKAGERTRTRSSSARTRGPTPRPRPARRRPRPGG
jgi:hypothetical protein